MNSMPRAVFSPFTLSVKPSGGKYGFRLYVFSFVWMLPSSVSRSRRSETHSRFCVLLYVANSSPFCLVSWYESVSTVSFQCFCALCTASISYMREQSMSLDKDTYALLTYLECSFFIIVLWLPNRIQYVGKLWYSSSSSFILVYKQCHFSTSVYPNMTNTIPCDEKAWKYWAT